MEEIYSEEAAEVTSLSVDNEAAPEKKPEANKAIMKLFSPQNRKKTIIAIAAILVVVIVAGCLISSKSPEKVAIRYVEAYEFEDLVTLHKVMAYDIYALRLGDMSEEEYFEKLSNTYDEDITSWKDLSKYNRASTKESLEDYYGDYKLAFDVSRVKDMSNRKLEEAYGSTLNQLENTTAFDRDDISDAKEVIVKGKLEGEDETERFTYTVCMVKMNGAWKALSVDYDN